MSSTFDVHEVLDRVPTPSTVALSVLQVCEDEHADVDDLTAVLEQDAALAARVLSLANSAFYSRGREVTSLGRAALVLGFRTLKIAALGFAIADGLPKDGTRGGLSLPTFWTRSVVLATTSRAFAATVGSTRREEAHLAGLLAEIGRIGLAVALPAQYEEVVGRAGPWPPLAAEQASFGMSSADFGSLLLGTWRLPSLYVWAPLIAHGHPVTSTEGEDVREVAPVLHLAREAVEVLFGDRPVGLARLHEHARRSLGIDQTVVDQQLVLLQPEVAAAAADLGVQVPDGLDVLALVDRARRRGLALGLEASMDTGGGGGPASGTVPGADGPPA